MLVASYQLPVASSQIPDPEGKPRSELGTGSERSERTGNWEPGASSASDLRYPASRLPTPTLPPVPIEAWILALVITFAAALIQGVVGVGFAMVSVPLLALIDPRLAPVPQLLIAIPMTMTMAWRERGYIELQRITWIIVGRFPGAIIGVALLAVATQVMLDLAIATIVLIAVAIIGSGYVVARNSYTEFGAGVLSGTTGLVASIGGPPLALLYADETGPVARSNLSMIFSIGLSIAVVARVLSGNIGWGDVRVAAVLFPALLVGYLLSGRLKDRLKQKQLRYAVLILSTIGAVGLIVRVLA